MPEQFLVSILRFSKESQSKMNGGVLRQQVQTSGVLYPSLIPVCDLVTPSATFSGLCQQSYDKCAENSYVPMKHLDEYVTTSTV